MGTRRRRSAIRERRGGRWLISYFEHPGGDWFVWPVGLATMCSGTVVGCGLAASGHALLGAGFIAALTAITCGLFRLDQVRTWFDFDRGFLRRGRARLSLAEVVRVRLLRAGPASWHVRVSGSSFDGFRELLVLDTDDARVALATAEHVAERLDVPLEEQTVYERVVQTPRELRASIDSWLAQLRKVDLPAPVPASLAVVETSEELVVATRSEARPRPFLRADREGVQVRGVLTGWSRVVPWSELERVRLDLGWGTALSFVGRRRMIQVALWDACKNELAWVRCKVLAWRHARLVERHRAGPYR